jgi:hypothetical protein
MEGQSPGQPWLSPGLLAAQQRLLQIRAAYQQAVPVPMPPATVEIDQVSALTRKGQALLLARRRQEAAAQPAPSAALQAYRSPRLPSPWAIQLSPAATSKASERPRPEAVRKVYPGILLAMLDHKLEAAGRVWLLLQYLDEQGSGRITVEEARRQLTAQGSELRICSWRNLRGLLQRGEGTFWRRDNVGRIWLRGAAKVADSLGTGRLQGRPVELPLTALLGGVGGLRAHFYASFHSGRKSSNPISRSVLAKLTHIPTRTQRTYEQRTGVTSRANVAVGEGYTAEAMQERAWQHGRATFKFVDSRGTTGAPNRTYIAWRLPNSYTGCHAQRPKGRQRKINRQIDLVKPVAQGNGRPVRRLFYRNGAVAGKAYNQDASRDAYWQPKQPAERWSRQWHLLPRKEGQTGG